MNLCYFCIVKKPLSLITALKYVSVVQWIEYWIPVPTIGVRLPTGIPGGSIGRLFYAQAAKTIWTKNGSTSAYRR